MAKKKSADEIVRYGGGIAAVALVAYLGISYKYFNHVPVGCMEGYPQAIRFGLQSRDGIPLSMIELQAQAGREEKGLMRNARIVNVDDAPISRVLDVNLGRADASDPESEVGIEFPWRPNGNLNAHSACLRYSVLLPEKFQFSGGGNLPGMFGGQMPGRMELTNDDSFVLRALWSRGGDAIFVAQSKALPENDRLLVNAMNKTPLQLGRWVTLEQELVLNAPGASDGEIRVWIDGLKVVEKKGIKLRKGETPGIDGVAATVGFIGNAREITAGGEAHLQITPLDFGWR